MRILICLASFANNVSYDVNPIIRSDTFFGVIIRRIASTFSESINKPDELTTYPRYFTSDTQNLYFSLFKVKLSLSTQNL